MSTTAERPTGTVFDVSAGCFDDGPGLRTVVFLKGCPLRCPWCHNPEGQAFAAEIAFDVARCLGCGQCEPVCPVADQRAPDAWRAVCTGCGRCAAVCPGGARRLAGRALDVDALVAEVLVDRDFFAGTGGGVTFSGGEPVSQPGFLFAAAAALRAAGVHLALETSGCWPAGRADEIAARFDLVLFDLKHVRADRLRQHLGPAAGPAMLDNLAWLIAARVRLELRLTLVPGFNDTDEDLRAIAAWIGDHPPVAPLRLQPFQRLASAKQQLFGRPYPYAHVPPLAEDRLAGAARLLREQGIASIVVG